jgi:hypothetical protein
MRSSFRRTFPLLLLCSTLSLLASANAAAQSADVSGLVDEVMEAYGGRATLDAVEAIRLEGSIQAHTRQARGSFVRVTEGQDRLKVLLHYPSSVEIRIIEGNEGWRGPSPDRLAPANGPLLGSMKLQAARSNVPWIMDAMRDRLTVERSDDRLTVLSGEIQSGLTLRFFIDNTYHHVLRSESELAAGPMNVAFATDYGDFREVDGVAVPFREESFASGMHTATLLIQRAVVNPDDAGRRLPAAR